MSNNLSIIKEDILVGPIKEIGNTSNDSGINSNASADGSNNDSLNGSSGTSRMMKEIIIPFKALNMERKESTILASSATKATCNISNIDGSGCHKNTIDSEGKSSASIIIHIRHLMKSTFRRLR